MVLTTLTSSLAIDRWHDPRHKPGNEAHSDDDDADPNGRRHDRTGEPIHDEADRPDEKAHQAS
ncbi:hypothetical protein PSX43_23200, partial [Shigella flexneri]|nr:hypothetical protein [Shigella flexneri]